MPSIFVYTSLGQFTNCCFVNSQNQAIELWFPTADVRMILQYQIVESSSCSFELICFVGCISTFCIVLTNERHLYLHLNVGLVSTTQQQTKVRFHPSSPKVCLLLKTSQLFAGECSVFKDRMCVANPECLCALPSRESDAAYTKGHTPSGIQTNLEALLH